jgi:trehalose-phosphatase
MTRPTTDASPEPQPQANVPMNRLSGRPLLLMLDVDGTLAPIVRDPALARVPDGTRRTLAYLASRRDIIVALVSGRAARDARRVVGVDDVWTVGNHGAEVLSPVGEVTIDAAVSRYADRIAQAAASLAPLVADVEGALLENKTWTLSVHYRNADPHAVPGLRTSVEGVAARYGLMIINGKKILDVRAPSPVDKGTAVARLAAQLGAHGPDAALLFAGDDATDEDAFRRLRADYPHAVTIHVGDDANTSAEFTMPRLEELHTLLDRIAATAAAAAE